LALVRTARDAAVGGAFVGHAESSIRRARRR
jgi:hypothetical protein